MSGSRKSTHPGQGKSTRALLLGASLSTLAIVGTASGVRSQSAAEEACAAVLSLKSPFTIERVLERYPNDPCVPLMLSSLAPELLGKLDPALVDALPPSQLRLIPAEIRAMIGVNPGPSTGTRRTVSPGTTTDSNSSSSSGYATQSQY